MRILVTTGRRAYDSVKRAVGDKADVLLLDVDVAALITPSLLRAIPNISSHLLRRTSASRYGWDPNMRVTLAGY